MYLNSKTDYRLEIDGLRAIALLSVIFFHANFTLFSGGFVGVDIFFVISGFLITRIILNDMKLGIFSIANFYERRARRILPALYVVMLACIPFAWRYFQPQEMNRFSQSLIATSLFSSNLFFWKTSGYFDSALKPLLHTWSLSVEEQFYFFFPLILILCSLIKKQYSLIIFLVILFISLCLANYGSTTKPIASFYLLPTRVWELLLGTVTAFYTQYFDKKFNFMLNRNLSYLGLFLILYSIFKFNKITPFPGFFALIPTLGSALIILCSSSNNLINKFLKARPLIFLGKISYSAYLWHLPLFVFAEIINGKTPSTIFYFVLILICLTLAYFSWKYIEQPFRNKSKLNRKFIIKFVITCSLFFIFFGYKGYITKGFKYRLPPNLKFESLGAKIDAEGSICKLTENFNGVSSCEFGDLQSSKIIFLYGDSHAEALSYSANKMFKHSNIKGVFVKINGCEVIPSVFDSNDLGRFNKNCQYKFNKMLNLIKEVNAEIIVASRWTMKLYPIKDEINELPMINSEGGIEKLNYREYSVIKEGKEYFDEKNKKEMVHNFIEQLTSSVRKVYVIYPIPEIAWDVTQLNILYYAKNKKVLNEISIPYSDFYHRNKFINKIFKAHENKKNWEPIKPELIFCNTFLPNRCVAQYKSIPYYYDDDHLSEEGADLVLKQIIKTK